MIMLTEGTNPGTPVTDVALVPGYPGAHVFRVTACDPREWTRGIRGLIAVSREVTPPGEDPWCGVIVAGPHRHSPRQRQDWSYWTGCSWQGDFSPHEQEHPHVFQSVRAACVRATALNGLPTMVLYAPCWWVRPDTYRDTVQEVEKRLQGLGFTFPG